MVGCNCRGCGCRWGGDHVDVLHIGGCVVTCGRVRSVIHNLQNTSFNDIHAIPDFACTACPNHNHVSQVPH